jgi:hypothetical protein
MYSWQDILMYKVIGSHLVARHKHVRMSAVRTPSHYCRRIRTLFMLTT